MKKNPHLIKCSATKIQTQLIQRQKKKSILLFICISLFMAFTWRYLFYKHSGIAESCLQMSNEVRQLQQKHELIVNGLSHEHNLAVIQLRRDHEKEINRIKTDWSGSEKIKSCQRDIERLESEIYGNASDRREDFVKVVKHYNNLGGSVLGYYLDGLSDEEEILVFPILFDSLKMIYFKMYNDVKPFLEPVSIWKNYHEKLIRFFVYNMIRFENTETIETYITTIVNDTKKIYNSMIPGKSEKIYNHFLDYAARVCWKLFIHGNSLKEQLRLDFDGTIIDQNILPTVNIFAKDGDYVEGCLESQPRWKDRYSIIWPLLILIPLNKNEKQALIGGKIYDLSKNK